MKTRLLTLACCLVLAAAGYVAGRSGWLLPAGAFGSTQPNAIHASASAGTGLSSQRDGDPASQDAAGEKTAAQEAADSVKARLDQLAALLSDGPENPMSQWSVTEIQTALNHLNAQPHKDKHLSLRQRLVLLWAKKDPLAAWQAALQLEDTNHYPRTAGEVLKEFAKTNPAAALELAASIKPEDDSQSTMYQAGAVAGWLEKDFPAALAWLKDNPKLVLLFLFEPSLDKVMQQNPAQAMESLLELQYSDNRITLTRKAMDAWLTTGKDAALQWLRGYFQADQADRHLLFDVLRHSLLDSSDALELIQSIPAEGDRTNALANYAAAFARKDPDAALAWINSQTDPELRKKLGRAFAHNLPALSPEEQTALLRRLPAEIGESLIAEITFKAANIDLYAGRYEKAITALNTLPASPRCYGALHDLGQQWAEVDPVAVANWANTQPPSNERDMLIAGFVPGIARQDARTAVEWLDAIENNRVRLDTGKNLFNRWYGVDPAAATAWLQSARLYTKPVMQQLLFDAPIRANSITIPSMNFGQ